ncbi:RPM1-interacting protein 4 [Senna tora]|uniref:RPM1-interacting protein 4 n=1 Tax=Senna tora TaxID=362788 RepID=A0A834TP23_9FABA|nr:RPM1-interacting protein 4 [Senna tora]
MINPNDPEENPDLDPNNSSSADLPPSKPRADLKEPAGKGSAKSSLELQKSLDSDPNDSFGSPARPGGQGVGSTDNRRRPSRQSAGSEYSIERSPLHRQARTPGRDSPSFEGKNPYDSSHGTPGRSRLRPVNRGDETPDRGAAVPKFGEWDESNPASADGYTHIFNKVREEKQGGGGHAPGTPTKRPYVVRNQAADDKAQSCCFGWCRK